MIIPRIAVAFVIAGHAMAASMPPSKAAENTKESQAAWDFFLSPTGNDAWSGRIANPNADRSDGPFATLDRARVAVRQARAEAPSGTIRVALRGGTYRLTSAVTFTLEDCAGETGKTVYAAYPGETPILSSGIALADWKRFGDRPGTASADVAKHLWSVDVPPALTDVLSLYDGLTPLPRAQGKGFMPPHGWKDDGAGRGPNDVFYFPEGIVDRYADFAGADLHVMPTANYEMNILPIAFVDRTRRLGITRLPASRPMGPMQFHTETMWIENRLEDLDRPGEWVFDTKNRKIYLWPVGDRPSADIIAPLLTELVRIEGAIDYAGPQDTPIRNLVFRGITFAHAERLPNRCQDGWGLQHCWETFDRPTALLRLRGAENCRVSAAVS